MTLILILIALKIIIYIIQIIFAIANIFDPSYISSKRRNVNKTDILEMFHPFWFEKKICREGKSAWNKLDD